MHGLRRVGGSAAYRTAHGVAASSAVPFADAYALSKLVLEHGGGPVPLSGRRAPFDRATAMRLVKAGLAELGGEGRVRQAPVVTSIEKLNPSTAASQEYTATAVSQVTSERLVRSVIVSDAGLSLVQQSISAPETDPRDAHVHRPADDPLVAPSGDSGADWAVGDDPDDEGGEADGPEPRDWSGELGELEPVAARLARVWWSGSEVKWMGYAWDALRSRGLADTRDRTTGLVHLGVLAVLNKEFAARAYREGTQGGGFDELDVGELIGPRPRLSEVEVGRLAERHGLDDPEASPTELVRDLVHDQWRPVTTALIEALGAGELFASLAWTPRPNAIFPTWERVDGPEYPEHADARAYMWLEDGCPV